MRSVGLTSTTSETRARSHAEAARSVRPQAKAFPDSLSEELQSSDTTNPTQDAPPRGSISSSPQAIAGPNIEAQGGSAGHKMKCLACLTKVAAA